MRYFSKMRPESAVVLERTKIMLEDFDLHAGAFEGLQYATRSSILRLDFIQRMDIPPEWLLAVLDTERLSLITGQPVSKEHEQAYQSLIDAARQWRTETEYLKRPVGPLVQNFPNIKKQIKTLKVELLDRTGLSNVRYESFKGRHEIHFDFPALVYGSMKASIEFKVIYDGITNFIVHSVYPESGDIYVMARDDYLTGAIHYAKFGIDPPEEMQFSVRSNSVPDDALNILRITLGISSYYRI